MNAGIIILPTKSSNIENLSIVYTLPNAIEYKQLWGLTDRFIPQKH